MTFKATQKDLQTILNRRWRLEHNYKIRAEDRTLRTLKFNQAQEKLFANAAKYNFRGIRQMVNKARKLGVSTFWELFYLDDTMWTPNTVTVVQSHRQQDLEKLFEIIKLAYDTCPAAIQLENGQVWYKPLASTDNAHELAFKSINSSIYVDLKVRGGTPNNLHMSEAAHITDEDGRILPTLGAIPNREKGSNITVESTANGMAGWFHDGVIQAENGLSEYDYIFFPWYEDPKHSMTAPPGWTPGLQEIAIREKVLKRVNIHLSTNQLYWWSVTRRAMKHLMDQEFPTFSEDSFLATGNAVLEKDVLDTIIPREPIRIWEGLRIWKEPKVGRRYVVGGDPAEGVGGDRSTIEVYDCLTLEQVAEYVNDRISPAAFATKLADVGKFYNNAIIAPERNNHGHTVLDRLKDIYSHIFMMITFDEKLRKKTKKLGWETNSRTRDLILDELEELICDGAVKINSGILKAELQTYITDNTGKRQAKSGQHDDTIMATAIALKVARMPRTSFEVYQLT